MFNAVAEFYRASLSHYEGAGNLSLPCLTVQRVLWPTFVFPLKLFIANLLAGRRQALQFYLLRLSKQ